MPLDVTFIGLLFNEDCHCVGCGLLIGETLGLALSCRADPAPAGSHCNAGLRNLPEFAGCALDKLEVARLGRCGNTHRNRRLWWSVGRRFGRNPPPHVSGYSLGVLRDRVRTNSEVAWKARPACVREFLVTERNRRSDGRRVLPLTIAEAGADGEIGAVGQTH